MFQEVLQSGEEKVLEGTYNYGIYLTFSRVGNVACVVMGGETNSPIVQGKANNKIIDVPEGFKPLSGTFTTIGVDRDRSSGVNDIYVFSIDEGSLYSAVDIPKGKHPRCQIMYFCK